MRRSDLSRAAAVVLLGSSAATAEPALMYITPQNMKGSTFTRESKSLRNDSVEFTIRRDVKGIDGPGRKAYLSNPDVDGKGPGALVKQTEDGNVWTFRFSAPAARLEGSIFTLWGQGQIGEGVTYRFRLSQFHKPPRD